MNPLERSIANKARKQGWRVYRDGWPDFVFYDEKTQTGICVEVKSIGAELSRNQKNIHAVLEKLGVKTCVVRSLKYVPKPPDL